MADLTFTTIEEPARAALEISRDEYAVCNYVQTWSTHPANKQPGWCDRTRQQMAAFIGVSPRGIMKMLDRLEAMGLIARIGPTKFQHRITQKWFDTVTLARQSRKGEQSAPFGENKVPSKGEQSAPFGENKVPPHNKSSKEVKGVGKPTHAPGQEFQPKSKVETADEAEAIILKWAEEEGRETVRNWYSNAARPCTLKDVKNMVQAFVHAYLTIGDEGKRIRMQTDPLQCFKYTFKVFLKGQPAFERKQEQNAQVNGNGTGSPAKYENPVIPVFTPK